MITLVTQFHTLFRRLLAPLRCRACADGRNSVLHLCVYTHLVMLALFISTPTFALTGRVINQTLNRIEPHVEVSYILHEAGDVTVVRDTTDSKGQFTLDIPPDPGAEPPPMLFARYNGIDYPGNPAPAGDIVDISVFETTDSDTAISLSSHHILLDAQAGTVTYIFIVHNHGDRTYLTGGDDGHGLEIPLPDGVTDILRAPQGVHLHDTLLVDPRPIIPGNSQTFFTFSIPPSNRIAQRITYPTAGMDLFVQPADTPVSTTILQDLGGITLGDHVFRRFGAEQLVPGTQIDIKLSSAEITSNLQTPILNNSLSAQAWIAAASMIVVAILVIYMRSLKTTPNRRTILLEQIADLDERYESGKLSEPDYKNRRNALKAEVIDLSTDN